MTERVSPGRGGHHHHSSPASMREGGAAGGGQYAALSERALQAVNSGGGGEPRLAGEPAPLGDAVVNHTVSFSSPSGTATGQRSEGEAHHLSSAENEHVSNDPSSSSRHDSLTSDAPDKPPSDVREPGKSTQQQHTPAGANNANIVQQKRHMEKMIQRGIDAGKDIDKKTIKSLSEEIKLLTKSLQEKDAFISSSLSSSSVAASSLEESLSPPSGRLQQQQQQQHTESTSGQLSSAGPQQQLLKLNSTHQIHLLYSFLFGGVVVLVCSTFITWLYGVVSVVFQ